MDARLISFGLIEIGGRRFEHDVVVDGGVVRRRKKTASKAYRDQYGHTPLSPDEAIPWSARLLIIGTGVSGQLPIMPELYEEARRRGRVTVGFAGYVGGRMAAADTIEHLFVVPSPSVHRIQEVQTTTYHVLWELTQQALG